jgi:oligoribonuclease
LENDGAKKEALHAGGKEEIRFVWIDLEMTGLNPEVDHILEIAVVVTGADLVPLGELTRVVHQSEETLEKMSKVVQRMHTRNGLIKDVLSSNTSLREAERAAMSLVVEHCLPGEAFLCGNSVHHDWRFLARHMPRLEQYLHYRQVDVSTIKVLVQAWSTALLYQKEISEHRALGDIRGSIAELRYYCEKVFRTPIASSSLLPGILSPPPKAGDDR